MAKILGRWNDLTVRVARDLVQLECALDRATKGFISVILMGHRADDFYDVARKCIFGGTSYIVVQSAAALGTDALERAADDLRDLRKSIYNERGIVITVSFSNPLEAIAFGAYTALPDQELFDGIVQDLIIVNFTGLDEPALVAALNVPFG